MNCKKRQSTWNRGEEHRSERWSPWWDVCDYTATYRVDILRGQFVARWCMRVVSITEAWSQIRLRAPLALKDKRINGRGEQHQKWNKGKRKQKVNGKRTTRRTQGTSLIKTLVSSLDKQPLSSSSPWMYIHPLPHSLRLRYPPGQIASSSLRRFPTPLVLPPGLRPSWPPFVPLHLFIPSMFPRVES